MPTPSDRPRGRYAPTPSGLIHVGNARTALVAWWSIRSQGGTFVWRLEDLDPPRALAGADDAAVNDLRWLGLDWDEGPELGGPHGPYVQSRRSQYYEAALAHLAEAGRLFPCHRSRKDLQSLASAPHGAYGRGAGLPPYPARWRPDDLEKDWYARILSGEHGAPAALRFRVPPGEIRFVDRVYGEQRQRVDLEVGDFVLKRKDGLYAYQLAVVVDDLAMKISEVVRGTDLIDSTARQIRLIEALGGPRPTWAHLPMVLNAEGEKLSKRDGGLTLRSLRDQGVTPESLVGYLAHSLGLVDRPEPVAASQLIERFAWQRIRRDDHTLPPDLAAVLAR